MEKAAETPAHLFRELGRAWARERDKKHRIADLHAATEAFRILLDGEKGLVHRIAETLTAVEREIADLRELEALEHVDHAHHWIGQEKLGLARVHACERALNAVKQGSVFLARWREHFGRVVPEMAHRFPHTHDLEQFFNHLDTVFSKKREEFENGHSFTRIPSLQPGVEQLTAIEHVFETMLEHLRTIEQDLGSLAQETKNKLLQELVFGELRKLAPLIYVTSGKLDV